MEELKAFTVEANTYRARRQSWLSDVASFANAFLNPEFQFASWQLSMTHRGSGMIVQCVLSDLAAKFVHCCTYALTWLPPFDWLEWLDSIEALGLYKDPGRIAMATVDQIATLLIAYIRNDRFNPGALNAAFENGILTAIVQRAQALVED